jgi:hypothetical protein
MLKLKSIWWGRKNNGYNYCLISYFFSFKTLSSYCMVVVVGFFSSLDFIYFESSY